MTLLDALFFAILGAGGAAVGAILGHLLSPHIIRLLERKK